jgi:hypothetical protein
MFKAGDEWLALPEVFSNLNFDADNSPASEDDIEGQLSLRASRFWGRLYIDGWPQTVQFFRAHFGIEPPFGRKRFVFAEPRDACEELTNLKLLTPEHVLLVHRGTCTFGQKAKNAHKSNASAVIIINNEPGLDHLPGPDAHDIPYSVSSIAQIEGQLLEAVYDAGPPENGFPGRNLEGYMVPINCENNGARCLPATYEERRNVKNSIEGGHLLLQSDKPLPADEVPMEYMLAHFGTNVPHLNTTLSIAMARPAEACEPLTNDVKGKIVLARRGSCPFVKKAEIIQAAGGVVMVLGSLHPYIVRMGVEPRWKGLNTGIAVTMVSKRTYSTLLAESFLGGTVSFEESRAVDSHAWEALEKLAKGEGWPRSASYINKKYEELKGEHKDYPDRLATLDFGYSKVQESLKAEL